MEPSQACSEADLGTPVARIPCFPVLDSKQYAPLRSTYYPILVDTSYGSQLGRA